MYFYLGLHPCDTQINSIFTNLMFLCKADDLFNAFHLFVFYFCAYMYYKNVYAPVLHLK